MGGVTFRTATRDDVPDIVALVESAYRGESSKAGWTTEADLLDGQRTDADAVGVLVGSPAGRVLLAHGPDGELLACAHIERRGARIAYFGMFSVRPTLQGGGLGKEVLAEAERAVREEWGATIMEMTVIGQREDLIAWYERRGYRRTSQAIPFPYGDPRFGLPRRPDLYFVVLRKDLGPAPAP
jgi:GNAT superfamily N-acetyltransferase